MANESTSSAGTLSSQSVDVDDLEVRITILTAYPQKMNIAAGFLNRRGWPTDLCSDASKLVETILKEKPDFVLVSLNFNTQGVLKVASLVQSTFGVLPILYADTSDSKTTATLANIVYEHKLIGLPSGPSIHRTIRKILMDKLNPPTSSDSGGSNDSSERTSRMGSSGDLAKERASSGGMGFSVGADVKTGRGRHVIKGDGTLGANQKIRLSDIGMGPKIEAAITQEMSDNILKALGVDPATIAASGMQEGHGTGSETSLSFEKSHQSPSEMGAQEGGPEGAGTEFSFSEDEGQKKVSESPAIDEEKLRSYGPLWETIEETIENVCHPTEAEIEKFNFKAKRLAFLRVKTSEHQGILILSSDSEVDLNPLFLEGFRNDLVGRLLARGDTSSVGTPMVDQFEECVPFLLAKEETMFLHAFTHEGAHMVIFFLPYEESAPYLEAKTKMKEIPLHEISPQHAVEFKAYLHLKKNNLYYLYLNEGRSLSEVQKDRLGKNGVEGLHIMPMAVEAFRDYKAKVRVGQAIAKFRKTKKAS